MISLAIIARIFWNPIVSERPLSCKAQTLRIFCLRWYIENRWPVEDLVRKSQNLWRMVFASPTCSYWFLLLMSSVTPLRIFWKLHSAERPASCKVFRFIRIFSFFLGKGR
ncbi:TPA: hypothetical protein GDO54_018640 [Pyxicephalus adspersus]|uniref:Uncharacterized protein n=1 Tax=Pyxicephalus adspersus TaxID=30357 RepID=A0AAV2ZNU3_PYXAD|nr:TPA: hypothetical protein GDO54_018640 [Pyxicephalus adspersus]